MPLILASQSAITVEGQNNRAFTKVTFTDEELNYGPVCSSGLAALQQWGKEFIEKYHKPKYAGYQVVISSGNTDMVFKVCSRDCVRVIDLTDVTDLAELDVFCCPPPISFSLCVSLLHLHYSDDQHVV
jgi:hypothetical protein